MTNTYTTTGVLSDAQTLILDKPLPEVTGRVRITVELLPDFWEGTPLAELARLQGVKPVQSLDELWGDFWPEEESIDEFISVIRQWRREATDPLTTKD